MLPAFLAMEDHSLGGSPVRGSGGPVGISIPKEIDDETVQLFLASADKAGWDFVDDLNAQDQQQIGYTPSTIKHGVRQSTANAFLWPVRRRPNLTIAEHDRGPAPLRRQARHRRRGAAGSRSTSPLARRSSSPPAPSRPRCCSSGPASVAATFCAAPACRHASPNVGERMIEQHGVALQVRFKREIGRTLTQLKAQAAGRGGRYLLTRQGPIGTAGYDLMAHIKSSPEVDRPDVQVVRCPSASTSRGPEPLQGAGECTCSATRSGRTPTARSTSVTRCQGRTSHPGELLRG